MGHVVERVAGADDEGGRGDGPSEAIEDGGERVGDGDVVVDEEAVGVAAAIGDAPAHGLARADEDLGFAGGVLAVGLGGGRTIAEAAGVDDGEEAVAQLALDRLRELDRDDARGKLAVEHGPKALADTSRVDDDVLRPPGLGE